MFLNLFYLTIYPLINEFFLFFIVCFCLLFGAIFANFKKFYFPLVSKSIYFFIFLSLIFSFLLILNNVPIFFIFWDNFLICDSLVVYGKILIIFFSLVWFLVFYSNILNFEFWILILLSIIALSLLMHAYDLLSIYLTLEFLSLIFYILTSMNRTSEFSAEAGLKYFILGAFASAFLLFGFCLLYSFTGLTNLTDFLIFFTGYSTNFYVDQINQGIILSFFCIFTALFFKLGAAPFHFWLPDVYEGAPTSVTAWFALLPKSVILILLIRFIFLTFGDLIISEIYYYLIASTFLSSLIGTIGAFSQIKWKRFIAFSSISHLSFFFLNLCSLNPNNLIYLFTYLLIYLFMTSSFFSFFNTFNNFLFPITFTPRFFNSLNSLNITNPILSILFSLILFSFAGIPPLAGFFAKFFVFYSAISTKFYYLLFIILFFNCISCFYYINLIKRSYFDNLKFKYLPVVISSSKTNSIILIWSSFFILLICFDFEVIFLFSNLMCSALV